MPEKQAVDRLTEEYQQQHKRALSANRRCVDVPTSELLRVYERELGRAEGLKRALEILAEDDQAELIWGAYGD